MSRIKVLSNELISQIAAGEVIERPASAVKELVENSIDAGASSISVEIEDGGLKKIRVVDNGCGMSHEDAMLAFERHATSKIGSIDDLFCIQSLGFRGEALASIASVARVVLKTKPNDGDLGTLIEFDGGKKILDEEHAGEIGTDISIFGLFRHTPVRKKYMKSERSEYGHIFEMLSNIALAHPEVGMRLMRDGKIIFDLAIGQNRLERIRVLYGSETSKALIPVQFHQSNLLISGFVGKPELARSGKKYQFLFVNGRAIESRIIGHAVREAFHSLLMHEKQPWYLLDINIDPQFVDVNVHPRKLEVKFLNQQEVYSAVRNCVHHCLADSALSPVFEPMEMSFSDRKFVERRDFRPLSIVEEQKEKELFEVEGAVMRPIAQIANSYIIAESEEGLVLIDQHAAHERVRYSRLMADLEKERVVKQALLTPLELDLGIDSTRLLEEYQEDFEAMGFELENFGSDTFLLRAVPAGIEKREPENLVKEVIADVTREWKENHVKNIREILLTYTACRGAIKFGDKLTLSEMEALLKDMAKTANSSHCPHGRPAIITLTFDKLETMFKRKNF